MTLDEENARLVEEVKRLTELVDILMADNKRLRATIKGLHVMDTHGAAAWMRFVESTK